MKTWRVYRGNTTPHDGIKKLPAPPKWRQFAGKTGKERELESISIEEEHLNKRGERFIAGDDEIDRVNAALYLRRPLLITGKPGTGKSSLAYSIAYELKLGRVLRWPITSRSTLQDSLYRYDAIGRLQKANLEGGEIPDIGKFITLGPLGTALLPEKYPRVLLIDEIDKSDIDLPNDLLNIFEEGEYEIKELKREDRGESVEVESYDSKEKVAITGGRVVCNAFPFIVMTNNGEREFPPPFLRRCIRLDITEPSLEKLKEIVETHFTDLKEAQYSDMIKTFIERRDRGELATDQLLNAIYLTKFESVGEDKDKLIDIILRNLNTL